MKPFKFPLDSDGIFNLNLKDIEGNTLLLADVLDLVLTFTDKDTGKRVARFRKTPAQGDFQIKEDGGQMFIEWIRSITEEHTPCTLNLQVTEIYTDASFPEGKRLQSTEPFEAIWLVHNDNADL